MQRYSCFLLFLLFAIVACNDNGPDNNGPTFDRAVMLQHYADELIIPAFNDAAQSAQALRGLWQDFEANPTTANLEAVKSAWVATYSTFQKAAAYNFGPAGEEGIKKSLLEEVATFPVNTALMEERIDDGNFSTDNFDRDTRGFLAMEYLLFEKNTDETLVSFTQVINNRAGYMQAVVWHIEDNIQAVADAWNGAYRKEFVENVGTDVGSSSALLYNEFVKSWEFAKNFKVGLPSGFRAGQAAPEPSLAEAYYSGFSREMLRLHLDNIERIYYGGVKTDPDAVGFEDYLKSVLNGPELISETEAQWALVRQKTEALPSDKTLAELMEEEHPSVAELHTEMLKMTRFFKSDMSSLLGISITFVSGDGD